MAQNVAYLQGGPCNGRTHTITQAEADAQEIICKQSVYKPGPAPSYHNGDIIYAYRGAVPKPPPPTNVKAARLHKGYADIRHSVNTVMPVSLGNAQRSSRAALRTLTRARRVKIR